MTSSTSKTDARKLSRERIQRLSAEDQHRASESINFHISQWKVFEEASRVLLFAALPGEPALFDLLNTSDGDKICFPKVEGDELKLFAVSKRIELKAGTFGIPEPTNDLPVVNPKEIDLALVPGLAFGRNGERLGRGGGYFDRFLPHLRSDVVIAGVCFECQIFEKLPMDSHDFWVDLVISEAGILSI